MGADLLRKARSIRSCLPEEICGPRASTIESRLFWEIIPELAHRLGVTQLANGELSSCLRGLDVFDLRLVVTQALNGLPKVPEYDRPEHWSLITRDVCAGNIVAIALDRVAPPSIAGDWISASIDRVCNDLGIQTRLTWEPQLASLRG